MTVRSEPGQHVLGDGELLAQMFTNLVENALTHTPADTSITMTVASSQDAVVDGGSGIPAGERDKVLVRFYRLDASRSTPGSDLGLSLVRAITTLHGAKLRLDDSAPGLRVLIRFAPPGLSA